MTQATKHGTKFSRSSLEISPKLQASALIEAMPYIRRLQGKTIVVKYGGKVLVDDKLEQSFAQDLAMLQLLGMRPVVVHGGGPRIDAVLQRIGKKSSFVQGMRVTDAETMEVIEWVLAGEVQGELVALINRFGGQGVGLTGTDGALIRVHKLHMLDKGDPGKLRDIGQVGEIEAINPIVIKALQDDGFIPVISPIGFDADGKTFNINADIVAGKIAEMLRAEKLVILTNAPGVLDRNGRLLGELNAHQIDELFADGAISCGMLPKISSALNSAKNGVNTVHIIDGRVDHSLLSEILTDQGVGTMILG